MIVVEEEAVVDEAVAEEMDEDVVVEAEAGTVDSTSKMRQLSHRCKASLRDTSVRQIHR